MAATQAQVPAQPLRRSLRIAAQPAKPKASVTKKPAKSNAKKPAKGSKKKPGKGGAKKQTQTAAAAAASVPDTTASDNSPVQTPTPRASFQDLPNELLLAIAEHYLETPAEVAALCLTCKWCSTQIQPVLYRDIVVVPNHPLVGMKLGRPLRFARTLLENPTLFTKTYSLRLNFGDYRPFGAVDQPVLDLILAAARNTGTSGIGSMTTSYDSSVWLSLLRNLGLADPSPGATQASLRQLLVLTTELILTRFPASSSTLKVFEIEDNLRIGLFENSRMTDVELRTFLPRLDRVEVFSRFYGAAGPKNIQRLLDLVSSVTHLRFVGLSFNLFPNNAANTWHFALPQGWPNIRELDMVGDSFRCTDTATILLLFPGLHLHVHTDALLLSGNPIDVFRDLQPIMRQLRFVGILTDYRLLDPPMTISTAEFVVSGLRDQMDNMEEIILDDKFNRYSITIDNPEADG